MVSLILFSTILSIISSQAIDTDTNNAKLRVWWRKAQAICNKTGSELVSITSYHEDELVHNYCLNELHWHCWIGLYAPSCEYNYSTNNWDGEFNGTWIWIDGTPYHPNETYSNWCPGSPHQGTKPNICDGGIHVFYDIYRGCWRNGFDGMFDDQSDDKWWKYFICNSDIITINTEVPMDATLNVTLEIPQMTTNDYLISIEEHVNNVSERDRTLEIVLYVILLFMAIVAFLFVWFTYMIKNRFRSIEDRLLPPIIDEIGTDTDGDTITTDTDYPYDHADGSQEVDYDFCDIATKKENNNDDGYVMCDEAVNDEQIENDA